MESQPQQSLTYDEFFLRYRLHIGDLTREAKHEMAERGELPGPAPLGYLNRRTGKIKTTVVVDADTARIVQEAFMMAAHSSQSLRVMLVALTGKGLRSRNGKHLQVSGLWYLLTNPFYAGFVRYDGKLFVGQHEPLVDQATFDRVQSNLDGRKKRQLKKTTS